MSRVLLPSEKHLPRPGLRSPRTAAGKVPFASRRLSHSSELFGDSRNLEAFRPPDTELPSCPRAPPTCGPCELSAWPLAVLKQNPIPGRKGRIIKWPWKDSPGVNANLPSQNFQGEIQAQRIKFSCKLQFKKIKSKGKISKELNIGIRFPYLSRQRNES